MKKFNKKMLLRGGVALMMSGSLILSGGLMPGSTIKAWGSTTHNKVGDGTYQLLDGTAITGIIARGVDVSHWQGAIDWNLAAQDDISFVMLGTRYKGAVDPMFHTNAKGAAEAGIRLGAYIYSYATDVAGAEAEADFILNLIKDYPISYPVAFDIEDSSQTSLSPTEVSNMINAFCKKIEEAGYYPIVYANDYWLANKIDLSQMKYDVWVARYEVKHVFEHPVMWQATSTGKVNGISGGVDIDFQYKDFSDEIPANLWRTIGDKTYYYQNYAMQKNAWIHDGTGWFYMNGDGQTMTGWMTQNGSTYYLDPNSGRMTQGWLWTDEGWRYFNENGAMMTGWTNDGSSWYHMNPQGIMNTGWLQERNTWYFLRDSGSMVTGWKQIGDVWYYFNESGAMVTGTHQIGDSWYHFDGNGAMVTGRQQINGNWYYFNETGAMTTGLQQIDENWYYLNPENGVMVTGTEISVDGVTYQVDASGVCKAVKQADDKTDSDAEVKPETSDNQSNESIIILPFGS